MNPAASSLFRAPHTMLMGILNVTPDSFSDGGSFLHREQAIAHGLRLTEEGADMVDVGGESTRPGSDPVSEAEELSRVLPVVEGLLAGGVKLVSVDTMKPGVAARCLQAGARIVNDVTGMRNPEMRAVAAMHGASVVVMHMRGTPKTMQRNPVYVDVVHAVRDELRAMLAEARAAGIEDVAIDPGIGFGKTAAHNFELLARLGEFHELGAPVLVGPSRKSFLASLPGLEVPQRRLEGTIAACVLSAMQGAAVVRVHDVAECKRALRVADTVKGVTR
ncbi:MAG: dihydropteroate synthase [Bryobacterales bacterium]|nr:dihydropteroate synthase [Bryobacterales bacterium]